MINNILTSLVARAVYRLCERFVRRPADVVIGGHEDPYLLRWHLLPRNGWLNIYLHVFMRSDDDRALHDHPWASLSLALDGRAREVYWSAGPSPIALASVISTREVSAGALVWRSARFSHCMLLAPGDRYTTLFVTGRRVREWGFWCESGWRNWRVFTSYRETGDSTRRGRGCE